MPFIRIVHSGPSDKSNDLAAAISKAASLSLSKPEIYVCVDVQHNPNLLFGGQTTPSVMIQVQSVGGSCKSVCATLTNAASEILSIDSSRIFVNFQSFAGAEWGMSGNTFGNKKLNLVLGLNKLQGNFLPVPGGP